MWSLDQQQQHPWGLTEMHTPRPHITLLAASAPALGVDAQGIRGHITVLSHGTDTVLLSQQGIQGAAMRAPRLTSRDKGGNVRLILGGEGMGGRERMGGQGVPSGIRDREGCPFAPIALRCTFLRFPQLTHGDQCSGSLPCSPVSTLGSITGNVNAGPLSRGLQGEGEAERWPGDKALGAHSRGGGFLG